ncbi:MAG: outer membrane beta-barrel protein, partial [Thermoflexibacteraceae bacterium]
SSVIYVEPISKKFYWETFVNLGYRTEKVDRNVFDKKNSNDSRLDSLSSFYTSQILFARSGTSLRYANKGLNVAFGVALQNFYMKGEFANAQNKPVIADINRVFTTIIPNISLNWELPNNKYLYAGYDVEVNQPTTRNLQPVIDNANPLYNQKGNPNHVPEVTHEVSAGFNSFNPATFFNYNGGLTLRYHTNQIIYNQVVDTKTLVTTVAPENVSGRKSIGTYLYSSFPIVKTKLTMNGNFNFNISDAPIFINGTKNQTFGQNYSGGLGFSFTPADFFTAYGNANWTYNKADYSLASALPQDFINSTYRLETNVRFPYFFFISTSLNYNIYANDRMNFNTNIALLNASIYKLFGKEKKFEVRLSAYDMLNQNVGISQTVTQNFVSREVVQTLARYFMFSVSYNMRGIKSDIRKRNNWE